MLKLLMISPSASRTGGGVSEAVRQLSHVLAGRPDIHLRVFALDDGETGPREEGGWEGIDVTTFPISGSRRFGFSLALFRAVLREKPDIVHVHGIWQFHCLPALILNLLRGIPYIVTPHGMMAQWCRARSKALKMLVSLLYQNRFLKKAYAVQILTDREHTDVTDMIDGARCVSIPNCVPLQDSDDQTPAWWNNSFVDKNVFLFFGRIHAIKGCLELCDAWEEANVTDPGFAASSVLVFCGPIDDIDGFEARVEGLQEHFGNVHFVGPQYGAEKLRSLAAASFLCLPSKSEGLPVTVLEAWATRTPVIMTPECNLPIGFERGAAIPTTNKPAELGQALRRASTLTQAERKTLAENGRMLLERNFSFAAVEAAMIKLYRDAAHDRDHQADSEPNPI